MGTLIQAIWETGGLVLHYWGGLSTAVGGGLELSYLSIKAFTGGIVAKNFPGHIVDAGGNFVAILLGDMTQGFSLREVAADYTVITFVTATFTAGIGMAIIHGQLLIALFVMFHILTILELRTVINCDGLKGAFGKLSKNFTKGVYSVLGGFAEDTKNDFIAGKALRQDKKGFVLAFGFAYHAIKFPMPEGGARIYFFWTVLYTGTLGRAFSLNVVIGPLAFGLLQKILIGDTRNVALVDVAVQGRG